MAAAAGGRLALSPSAGGAPWRHAGRASPTGGIVIFDEVGALPAPEATAGSVARPIHEPDIPSAPGDRGRWRRWVFPGSAVEGDPDLS